MISQSPFWTFFTLFVTKLDGESPSLRDKEHKNHLQNYVWVSLQVGYMMVYGIIWVYPPHGVFLLAGQMIMKRLTPGLPSILRYQIPLDPRYQWLLPPMPLVFCPAGQPERRGPTAKHGGTPGFVPGCPIVCQVASKGFGNV